MSDAGSMSLPPEARESAAEAAPVQAPPIQAAVRPAAPSVPRRFRNYLALDDFEKAARRMLPRMIYGYVSGAVETGSGVRQARQAYADLALVPRTLMDVAGRQQTRDLFGTSYASPFGIAPLGGAAMVAYRADIELASAARATQVPMILSASSLIKLEEVHRENPDAWFQAYLAGHQPRIDAMIDRVAAAGFGTLVVTADTPVPGNRENNTRSGFSMPLRITPKVALDSALHPRWLLGTVGRTFLRHGVPHFENMDAAQGPPMFSRDFVRNMNSRDQLAWRHVEAIRRRWKGKLVVKGLLAAADVAMAREVGADGVIVSNHGGRQLDYALAPIEALQDARAEARGMTLMVDGGIRRGTDVLKALALGADFVFLGRPFLYAASLGGSEGVQHAIRLLAEEIHRDMALMGLRTLAELTPDMVRSTHMRRREPACAEREEPR
ncbi:alpha-hydroxy-acid oxidizing protein [Ancylobacter sp. A5.8]|uniref:alpha-hydroxy acid oxidase n=1 Tax=Ancylobacter gelatini TaxID=2919920 RepID=UPI001F4E66C2|nr:alpha-hydroxy acid oxidase [Ancylobacter gelatini]MCJ8141401.1 alpha-hydroxy-acid oxidizing protein [Ancylobacter gelatini]